MSKVRLVVLLQCLFFIGSTASFAFDLGGGLSPPSQQKFRFGYSGIFQPQTEFDRNRLGQVGLLQTHLTASIPVLRGEKDGLVLSGRTSWLDLRPDQSGLGDFYDVQVGASYTHLLDGGRSWSVAANFGSPSDKPFKDSNVNTIGARAFYSFPSTAISSWLILVDYSNNRPILNGIPIPGFAYSYFPSKTFRGTFGLPFASIYWEFVEKWSLTFFTVMPWIAKAQIGYRLVEGLQLQSGFDFSQLVFLKHGRQNSKERIFYDEKKVFFGARQFFRKSISADLETGYSFGRRFFVAERYRANPKDPTELGATWYGKLGINIAF